MDDELIRRLPREVVTDVEARIAARLGEAELRRLRSLLQELDAAL